MTLRRDQHSNDHHQRKHPAQGPHPGQVLACVSLIAGYLAHQHTRVAQLGEHDEQFDERDDVAVATKPGLAQVARGQRENDDAEQGLYDVGDQQIA
ncbi:hypothetical protein [Candidatus Amarolinea dominans]|uniref:hypothetical protein n=1 Tax=Candidatus Amarolinea dominans TaxID=3140696 RepID=UPI001D9A0BB2|nr:hypothetical protein [Anaerolineae bacterium]